VVQGRRRRGARDESPAKAKTVMWRGESSGEIPLSSRRCKKQNGYSSFDYKPCPGACESKLSDLNAVNGLN